ncbi:zinc finger protein 182-like isoform X5 [Pleurodeles waltl]|uniref:zinc finger protein 182-like isoform X5 n=1 Tax=Pleurodeles waltl TaxID=8319 RepID=UPI003709603A
MSWQDSDKAPVTFRDVAAYFSQEEWKLLHEWQKELYKNIMNDIQQALISLGPLVAASVFSLRSKEKEDVCLVNCQESEQIPSVNNFPGDVINSEDLIFRIHAEENLLIRNPLDLERDKKNDCVNTGYPVHNPEIGLRKDAESSASLMEEPGVKLRGGSADPSRGHAITTSLVSVCPKKEGADYIMDRSDCERRESSAPPSAGYPYPKTDFALRNEEAATVCLIDHYDVEEQEMRMNPIKGHAVTPLDISVCIKEEEEVYSVEHHDIERMDSGSSPTGVSTVISFSVKEEDRHHPIDQQETGEEERIINPADYTMFSQEKEENLEATYTTSQKGKKQLIVDGYIFNREKDNGERTMWKCPKYYKQKCRGRAITKNEKVIHHTEHNHVPSKAKTSIRKRMRELKARAGEKSTSTSEILKDKIAELPFYLVGPLSDQKK